MRILLIFELQVIKVITLTLDTPKSIDLKKTEIRWNILKAFLTFYQKRCLIFFVFLPLDILSLLGNILKENKV